MKRLFACFLLAAGVMLLSVASYGQTVITSVPYAINNPGIYVLNTDLAYAGSGTAIAINSHDVTLDFQGHLLYSTSTTGTPAIGVGFSANEQNVTIKNGTLSAFNTAINIPGGIGQVVEGMRIESYFPFGQSGPSGPNGIIIMDGSGCLIDNNYLYTCWIAINDSNSSDQISRNRIFNCSQLGILVAGDSYLEGNFVSHCQGGISCTGGAKLRFNTTEDCTYPFTGGTLITDGNN